MAESDLPTGTVTFLLTDVEGSTKLWEAGPDETAASIARHYELLEAAIALHGGVRPVEQGEGDSVVGAFATASDAVAAALDVQRAFAAGALAAGWRGARPDGAPHRRDPHPRCRELLRSDDHPLCTHAIDRSRWPDADLRHDPRHGGRRAPRRCRAARSRTASTEGSRARRADLAAGASRAPARLPAVAIARSNADEPPRARSRASSAGNARSPLCGRP